MRWCWAEEELVFGMDDDGQPKAHDEMCWVEEALAFGMDDGGQDPHEANKTRFTFQVFNEGASVGRWGLPHAITQIIRVAMILKCMFKVDVAPTQTTCVSEARKKVQLSSSFVKRG